MLRPECLYTIVHAFWRIGGQNRQGHRDRDSCTRRAERKPFRRNRPLERVERDLSKRDYYMMHSVTVNRLLPLGGVHEYGRRANCRPQPIG